MFEDEVVTTMHLFTAFAYSKYGGEFRVVMTALSPGLQWI